MRVAIGCESSGAVREAMRKRGHDAVSIDLLPAADGSPNHLQKDVLLALEQDGPFDLLIVHPPCTYLCSSGLHWNVRRAGKKFKIEPEERARRTAAAVGFVRQLLAANVPKIALENPIGRIGTAIRKADQIIQPYEFGDDASKATGLWLKGLPALVKDPAKRVPGRWVTVPAGLDASGTMQLTKRVERWANQTDSGQNRLGPSADRWSIRSVTYAGIADAMADQWGGSTARPAASSLLDFAERRDGCMK